ncbi:MAG: TonB-dependent receptor [Thiobacillus sp.]|nr:TonB-dependent receptor [Thiobacillus sp.]
MTRTGNPAAPHQPARGQTINNQTENWRIAVTRRLRRLSGHALLVAACLAGPAHAEKDLAELSLENLMGITIVGASKYEQKQSEAAAAVSVITREEIKAFGWRTLAEALSSLPGIYTSYDRQYVHFGTRGFNLPGDFATRVLIMIDGNRTNDATFDAGSVGRDLPLDLGLVERIEFIPGPGGAVYGQNAMFGVVNIITRKGQNLDGGELNVAYQDPQRLTEGRVSWGKRLDNGLDVILSGSGMHARGEDRYYDFLDPDISGVARGLDGERDKEFFARIGRGPWAVELVYGDHRKYNPSGVGSVDPPLTPGQYQGDRYTLAQWQYQDKLRNDTLQVMARLFVGQERYTSVLSYGSLYSYPAQSDWWGGELRLMSTALAHHKLMVGIEYQDNTRIVQDIIDLAAPEYSVSIPDSGYRVGVYVQDEWRLTDTLTSTLGLRIDRNNVTGTQASPRAGLIWQADPATVVKALYGRAHRAPNDFESKYQEAGYQTDNPDLGGETIDTLELVADHRLGNDINLRASIYKWTMRDLITLGKTEVDGEELNQYQSGGTVQAKGIELSADKTWRGGGRLRGSLSFQDVRDAADNRLDNSPRWLGKLNYSAPLPWGGLRLGYELRYEGQRRALGDTWLDSYWLSNLNLVADKLARGLEVSLAIQNLFDQRYQHPRSANDWDIPGIEQDGRSLRLNVDYRF